MLAEQREREGARAWVGDRVSEQWGPSHQYSPPPRLRRPWPLRMLGRLVGLYFAAGVREVVVRPARRHAVGVGVALARCRRRRVAVSARRPAGASGDVGLGAAALAAARVRTPEADHSAPSIRWWACASTPPCSAVARFWGCGDGGGWAIADGEQAVMVLGPPRSGKSSSRGDPGVAGGARAGGVDVDQARGAGRSPRRRGRRLGTVWVFDPAGSIARAAGRACGGCAGRRSVAAGSWDGALLMARAMTAGTPVHRGSQNEEHWTERAGALLAPLLLAANLAGRDIGDVARWVLRQDIDAPAVILEEHEQAMAGDVLIGIAQTEGRERSSIYSATAGVLAAYRSDAARARRRSRTSTPERFVASQDTVYVCAPAHKQALCAPLVVGLLEEIRHATYARHASGQADPRRPVFFCLDEVANIAPIHDLAGTGVRGRRAGPARPGLPAGPQPGPLALGRPRRRRVPVAVSDEAGAAGHRRQPHAGSDQPRPGRVRPLTRRTTTMAASAPPGLVQRPGQRVDARSAIRPPANARSHRARSRSYPAAARLLLSADGWGLLRLAPWYATAPWREIAAQPPPRTRAASRPDAVAARGRSSRLPSPDPSRRRTS